jgi:flagellin
MTRINTNVSSLVAQNRLQSSNNDLSTALTRLSTGLRINSGADDPAGLIASEALRSEITGLNKAISNTQRASQIISTADSALGQVSNLLNDIRGLVVEAANTGGLSDSEVAANQLQIDSSLEAINRIAQTTKFQGRKLLDGGLGFQTNAGTNFNTVKDLKIDQANLGSTGSVSVEVTVDAAAERAQVEVENIPALTTETSATATLTVTNTDTEASGAIALTNGGFTLTAVDGQGADGVTGNTTNVDFVDSGGGATSASYAGNVLTVSVNGADSIANIAAAIDAEGTFATSAVTGTTFDNPADIATIAAPLSGGVDATTLNDVITITADTGADSTNGLTVTLIEDSGIAAGTASASFNGDNIEVRVNDNSDVAVSAIADAISALDGYSAAVTATAGDGIYNASTYAPPTATAFAGGVGPGGLAADAVFELQGSKGSEVFNVSAGTSIDELISQINLVSDATGITAAADGTTLQLTSSDYGSDAVVDLRVIEEAATGTFTTEIDAGARDEGTDIVAKVNGVNASGRGNQLSINTSTLDVSVTVDEGSSANFNFTIDGGGALFQLGADVVGNQQARIGIDSVNTARLGGISGKLFQLGSGGSASLSDDPTAAAKIISEAVSQITSLRGRLGAFQVTTLDSNLVSLNETKAKLQEAESSIRDADFAQETANLTRAQILVQSGTNVLSLANQNPQNVLALLR